MLSAIGDPVTEEAKQEVDVEDVEELDEEEEGEEEEPKSPEELAREQFEELRGRMGSFRRDQQWTDVLHTWQEMQSGEIQPDLVSYNAAVRAMLATNQTLRLLATVKEMRIKNINPNEDTYASAIYACGLARNSTLALALFNEAKRRLKGDLAPSVYQSVLYACMRTNAWQTAVSLFREARGLKEPATKGILKYTLAACCSSGEIEQANDILKEAEEAGDYEIRGHQYAVLIAACEQKSRWREILALAGRMGQLGTPDEISCCSVLRACREVGQWQPAVQILAAMRDANLEPDGYAYSMVIGVCSQAEQYEEVARLFEDAQQDLLGGDSPLGFGKYGMSMAVSAIHALTELHQMEAAEALCRKALDQGWLQVWRSSRFRLRAAYLDLAGLPPAVAKIATRLALEDLASDPDGKRRKIPRSLQGGSRQGLNIVVKREEDEEEGEETVAGVVLQVLQELCGPSEELEVDVGPLSTIKMPAQALEGILLRDVRRAVADTGDLSGSGNTGSM